MITKVTPQMVREHASELHGLDLSGARCEELARDLERHAAAIDAASPHLDFNDQPASFTALLKPASADRKTRR